MSCVALISQLLNLWYYKNNIKPTFLQPLKVISGLVSPQSIGFTNESDIYLNRSKILLFVSRYLSLSIFLFLFIFSFVILFLNTTLYQIIFLSILWSLLFMSFIHFSAKFIIYQITYFYIICYYLKLKLNFINDGIEVLLKLKKNLQNSYNQKLPVMKSLNAIYPEIDDYNRYYWSEYLFLILILIISAINVNIILIFFKKMNFIVRFSMIYSVSFLFLIFVIILSLTSSIAFKVNKSYKLLNKLYLKIQTSRIKITNKIKLLLIEN